MPQQVDAIYENGVLKPVVPLSLPDKARVKLTVEAQPVRASAVQPQDEWERSLLGVAKDCGVSLTDSALSSEELYE
jgi:predicted DNA-binding antitoxin AbrB/MazE fold protein